MSAKDYQPQVRAITTSKCMQDFYINRFKGHERDEARRADINHWLAYLSLPGSVPKKHKMTMNRLIMYFKTGRITCAYYVFLIRAALSHYYNISEYNGLHPEIRQLSMYILERECTLREAAEELGMLRVDLVKLLNGHKPVTRQLEAALRRLNTDIASYDDAEIRSCCMFLSDEVDFLDWDPEDPDAGYCSSDTEEDGDDESEDEELID